MKIYVVIGADRSVRVAKRPRLQESEVAVAINLTFPNSGGNVIKTVDVDVPDWAPTVEVEGSST
jgi:hypothetical protein